MNIKFLRLVKRFITGLAVTGSMYHPIHAETLEGHWLGRLMMLKVTPVHVDSEVPEINGEIYTPDVITPSLDFSYFVTDNWAVEFQGGFFSRNYSVINSKLGDLKVGCIENITASATLQYRFHLIENINPYIGIGVNYAHAYRVKPASGISDFAVKDITSTIANVGVDYNFNEDWFMSASLRYILSPAYTFSGEEFSTTVKMNTIVYGLGVGYLF